MITKQFLITQLQNYLNGKIELNQLVDWAENVMMDSELEPTHFQTLREIIARIGLSDTRAFGLTYHEIQQFLSRLGIKIHIQFETA